MHRLAITFVTTDDADLDATDEARMRALMSHPAIGSVLHGVSNVAAAGYEAGETIEVLPLKFVAVSLVETAD